jgi:nitrogen fixation protein NifX
MLRVAFATSDGTHVDQHFGWTTRFDVYDIESDTAHQVETRTLAPAGEDEEGKIQSRLDAVTDCAIVHVARIGGTAAARVIAAKIHPVKVPETTEVAELVTRLQAVVSGNPPPWLRKVLRQHAAPSSQAERRTGAGSPS